MTFKTAEKSTITLKSVNSGISLNQHSINNGIFKDAVSIDDIIHFENVFQLAEATDEIEKKRAALGSLPGGALADVEEVNKGYVRRFEGCDIYYSRETGAHEVHGDIRLKYNALGGSASSLGFPVTDETTTPDGIGRYNHFQGGSVYWTINTGPFMVAGHIRDLWAAQGWETGMLGYPVADQYRLRSFSPAADPVFLWSFFENGAIVSTPQGTAVAMAAEIGAEELKKFVRQKFDEEIHKSPENIGLQPQIEILNVSGYGFGFWASRSRMITFRLHGFHDNGLAPDTDFELDVRLRFGLAWQPVFTEPAQKTLVIELDNVTVHAHGLSSGSVADGVANGVVNAFKQPLRIIDIPTGAMVMQPIDINFIGLLVTAAGGLQFLVNPVPDIAGKFRKTIAQQQIDNFLGL